MIESTVPFCQIIKPEGLVLLADYQWSHYHTKLDILTHVKGGDAQEPTEGWERFMSQAPSSRYDNI